MKALKEARMEPLKEKENEVQLCYILVNPASKLCEHEAQPWLPQQWTAGTPASVLKSPCPES